MPTSLYQRGTISVTNGSDTVTGADTRWLATDIREGDILRVTGHAGLYFVKERTNSSTLVLDTPFTGSTDEDLTYTISRMSGDWGSIRVLGLEVSEYVRTFTANALTEEALTEALEQIEAALAEITTTQFMESSGMPASGTGNVGDWAIDPETGEVWKKTGVSTWTAKGNFKGTIGQDGATIHIVAGADPGSGLGHDGDLALNDSTSELFKKVAGAWVSVGFFVGAVTAATAAKDAAVAAKTAAETAKTNAETAQTGAAASASTATTKAGEASSSATVAAGSATTASTQAGIATTKADDAATSATAAANAAAVAGGLRFTWSTNTAASDPTSGKVKANGALGAATALYVSETDKNGAGMAAVLATIDDSTSPTKAFLLLRKIGAPQNFMFCSLSANLTDNGSWDTFAITVVASNGSFADGDDIGIEVQRNGNLGSTGATGATGPAIGVTFTYSSNATDADPGNGVFRFNNGTISGATAAYVDNLDSAGNSVTAWLDTFDDSTSTTKGYLMVRGVTTQTAWALFRITGSVVDGTGYRKLTLTHVGSGGTFTAGATFTFGFTQTGDAGTGSVTAVNGQSGSVTLTTDDISDTGRTNKWATAGEKTKIGYLTVTASTDLDAMRTNVSASKTKTDFLTVTSATDLDTIRAAVAALGTAATKNTGTGAGQVPVLDGSGVLSTSVLPALAITDVFEVASQSAMLALTAEKGDVAIRTDLSKSFVLSTSSPSTLADWKELRTPTDVVLAVAGLTGTITGSALKAALAIAVADITDMSANGRSLVSAANYTAMRALLAFTMADITDASANGRSLIQASDYAAMKVLLGLDQVSNTSNATERAATATLTNKRITPRVFSEASNSTPTPNADSYDQHNITALAAAAAWGAPSGTPTDGQKLLLRIKDNGTARALTWNGIFRSVGATLPTTTVVNKTMYVGLIYNAADTKWDCVAVVQEA